MKKHLILLSALLLSGISQIPGAWAGNDAKRGQGGAPELLLNPWARSTGFHSANTGAVTGVEAMMLNIAGLSYSRGMEFNLAHTRHMAGSDVSVNAFGMAIPVSETGVLGISLVGLSLGDFVETTFLLPEGTGTTFRPQFFNLGIGYSQRFSQSITGGVLVRTVYQAVSNVTGLGVGLDAGIMYRTGTNDRFKFGVAIRNVGPKMSYRGEGLSFRGQRDVIGLTLDNRSAAFDLPATLNIGASYDILTDDQIRLTGHGTFFSNSYTADHYVLGAEFAFREMFMVRGGYRLYQGFANSEYVRTDIFTGLSAGATFQLPIRFNRDGEAIMSDDSEGNTVVAAPGRKTRQQPVVGLDYSFRATNPFNGTHSLGILVRF